MKALTRYRLVVIYMAVAEFVYLMYEWQLPGGPHSGSALASGLLLAALSLPAGLGAGWLQWHAGILLGYPPGDTQAFLPRLIACQAALIVNALLLVLVAVRRSPRTAPSASSPGAIEE